VPTVPVPTSAVPINLNFQKLPLCIGGYFFKIEAIHGILKSVVYGSILGFCNM
jgi:hypothetical protein